MTSNRTFSGVVGANQSLVKMLRRRELNNPAFSVVTLTALGLVLSACGGSAITLPDASDSGKKGDFITNAGKTPTGAALTVNVAAAANTEVTVSGTKGTSTTSVDLGKATSSATGVAAVALKEGANNISEGEWTLTAKAGTATLGTQKIVVDHTDPVAATATISGTSVALDFADTEKDGIVTWRVVSSADVNLATSSADLVLDAAGKTTINLPASVTGTPGAHLLIYTVRDVATNEAVVTIPITVAGGAVTRTSAGAVSEEAPASETSDADAKEADAKEVVLAALKAKAATDAETVAAEKTSTTEQAAAAEAAADAATTTTAATTTVNSAGVVTTTTGLATTAVWGHHGLGWALVGSDQQLVSSGYGYHHGFRGHHGYGKGYALSTLTTATTTGTTTTTTADQDLYQLSYNAATGAAVVTLHDVVDGVVASHSYKQVTLSAEDLAQVSDLVKSYLTSTATDAVA